MNGELEHPPLVGHSTEPGDTRPPTDAEPGEPGAEETRRSSIPRTIVEIVVIVTAAFVIALLVQALLVKPFTIHQVSMRPTLEDGDRILLNRLAYHFHAPSRGDVIVFHSPINAGEDLVKRIVGVAGDTIEVKGGKLYRNGVAQNEPYILEQYIQGDTPKTEVPVGSIYAMGDNRNNSSDCRVFGPVLVNAIIGKAMVVYWPVSHWTTL